MGGAYDASTRRTKAEIRGLDLRAFLDVLREADRLTDLTPEEVAAFRPVASVPGARAPGQPGASRSSSPRTRAPSWAGRSAEARRWFLRDREGATG